MGHVVVIIILNVDSRGKAKSKWFHGVYICMGVCAQTHILSTFYTFYPSSQLKYGQFHLFVLGVGFIPTLQHHLICCHR